MNGEQLYEVWRQSMKDKGVEVDPWADLAAEDQAAWQEAADAKAEPVQIPNPDDPDETEPLYEDDAPAFDEPSKP